MSTSVLKTPRLSSKAVALTGCVVATDVTVGGETVLSESCLKAVCELSRAAVAPPSPRRCSSVRRLRAARSQPLNGIQRWSCCAQAHCIALLPLHLAASIFAASNGMLHSCVTDVLLLVRFCKYLLDTAGAARCIRHHCTVGSPRAARPVATAYIRAEIWRGGVLFSFALATFAP